jgi:hypothetical protein
MSSIEQLLYRHMDRTSSSTGSPCFSLMQAVLGLMERMLPSQRRRQEKSLQLYQLLCDFWVVNKEAITGSGQKEEWKYLMESSFHYDMAPRCDTFCLIFYIYICIHLFNHIHTEQSSVTVR